MSEESSPTSIRLKPKLKLEGDGPAKGDGLIPPTLGGAVEPEQGSRLKLKPRAASAQIAPLQSVGTALATSEGGAGTEPKVRLKPKLILDADNPVSPSPENPVSGVVPPPVLFADEPKVVESPTTEASVTGFKLKPRTPEALPPLLGQPDPAVVLASDAVQEAIASDLPPPLEPPIAPSPELIKSFDTEIGSSARSTRKRRSPLLIVFLLVVLSTAGYFSYSLFFSTSSAEGLSASVADSSDGPESMAGAMIGKAEAALAARAEGGSDLSELGIENRGGSTNHESGVMAAMPPRPLPAPPPPRVSASFQRFVAEMRISGVFQGEPARAMINGRTIREGDLVDPGLGIRFLGLDIDRRLVLLEEPSGAQAAKKY